MPEFKITDEWSCQVSPFPGPQFWGALSTPRPPASENRTSLIVTTDSTRPTGDGPRGPVPPLQAPAYRDELQDLALVGVREALAEDLGAAGGEAQHVQAAVLGTAPGQPGDGEVRVADGLDLRGKRATGAGAVGVPESGAQASAVRKGQRMRAAASRRCAHWMCVGGELGTVGCVSGGCRVLSVVCHAGVGNCRLCVRGRVGYCRLCVGRVSGTVGCVSGACRVCRGRVWYRRLRVGRVVRCVILFQSELTSSFFMRVLKKYVSANRAVRRL